MKAIIHSKFGAPEQVLTVGDTERPEAGDGEVVVRVAATALSKGDWLIAEGIPYVARPMYGIRRPKHRVAGQEFAGVVESVGAGVTRFSEGDEVFGWGTGALAEYLAVPEAQIATKPSEVGFDQAAAIPVSGFAALQAVREAGVGPDDHVLVIGASGGVGSFAVQIAKSMGAEVTGVAGTSNLERVRSLGADHVVDYRTEEIPDDGRYRAIIDIAGNRSLKALRRSLARSGTLVIVGGSGGRATMGFGRTVRSMFVSPFVSQRLRPLISKPNVEDLVTLGDLVASGDVTPSIGERYDLADAPAAIAAVGAGRSVAKSIVSVG